MKSLFASIVVSMLLVGSANAGLLRDLFGPNDDQRCQSYGFRPGTRDYAMCRMTIDTQRQQNEAAYGNSLERAGKALQGVGTPPPGITCINNPMGMTCR